MFELSFAEMAVIALVAVLVIGPKELPTAIRAVMKGFYSLKSLGSEMRKGFDTLAEEAGIKDIEKQTRMIEGDDGTLYEAYDVSDPPETKRHE